jgi:FlaA1/EpsC-like NDP-sugar epimerase
MSISEAVQLVMTAGAMGTGGEIFLLDMGEPIKILDIATKLINFSGLKPGKDVEIVFTGLRPGEKLHEELYWQGEGIVPTENKKITMLKPNGLYPDRLYTQLNKLEESSHSGNIQSIYTFLKEIVPEAKIGNGVQSSSVNLPSILPLVSWNDPNQ